MTALDFPWWLRITHFFNFLLISLLWRSGIEILSSHPKLYFNDDCRPGSEWLSFTRKKMPAHELWTSRDEEISLNSVVALPGRRNLGLGRHWHFLSDIGWLTTGIVYIVLLFATDEWRRLVPTSWSIFPSAWHAAVTYASFHLVVTPGRYNPLQQLAYFGVVFLLAPFTILTGLAMSPAIAARYPWYIKIFHGRQAARSLHFLCLCAFTLFFIGHITMVVLHGFARELAKIVLGEVAHPNFKLALILGWFGIGVVILVHVLATEYSLHNPRMVQRRTQRVIDLVRHALFSREVPMEHYPRSDISPYFRVNGRPPRDSRYEQMARNQFEGYVLEVCGSVENPLRLTLADLRQMPKRTQITKHCCIQGWSAVAEWGGVELREIIRQCRPTPTVRWATFFAFDDKSETEPEPAGSGHFYGTISMRLACHPQTILAYEMNYQPLPIAHGAPLRLRVETQLGFTMVKYLRAIEFLESYAHIGLGQGGWREDYQFYSPEAGI
ncbi:MAG: molybdopterin-dependent oxidoreductase [Terriglobia bacterium]